MIGGTASIKTIRDDLQFLTDFLGSSGRCLDDLEIGQSNLVHLVEEVDRERALEEQAAFFSPSGTPDAMFRSKAGSVYLTGTIDDVLGAIAERAHVGLSHLFMVPFPGQERSQLRLWEKHLIPVIKRL